MGDNQETEGQQARPIELRGMRILVVDDDDTAGRIVAELLALHGATVEVAHTIGEALSSYERHAPDLLVSDINIADESGYDLLGELRLRGLGAPAVAISGDGERAMALERGFLDYLPKPVGCGTLIETVGRYAR